MEKLIKNLTWMNLVNKLKVILTELSKGSGETNVSSDNITDATTLGKELLKASNATSARTTIGAGTSNLAIGTTATTAKAGNYQPTAANISDASEIGRTVLTAADANAVRSAIGAGTSDLALGTTASTAKAGNYVPTWAEVTGKPTFLTIGTTATTAKAGNYVPTWAEVTGKPSTFAPTIGSTATTAAAGNHTHSVATTSAIGFMSTADKIKLDNIAAGATANDTDANLLNRANHTGTQPFTTLSGVATAAQIPALTTSKITSGTFNIAQTNSVLAGYAVGTAGPIAATDTLLQALGKLEARLVALETA